jgi:hypothetical protein
MLSLNDKSLELVTGATKSLQPLERTAFMAALADYLRKTSHPGEGHVREAVQQLLNSGFWFAKSRNADCGGCDDGP